MIQTNDNYAADRERMVRDQLQRRDIVDNAVLQAMREVPRHEFVPESVRSRAYMDCALPTMNGQTISQPYMVAVMTQLLQVAPGQSVLELGTGSGYQAAVLAALGAAVHTIERDPELSDYARGNLERTGFGQHVTCHVGDGSLGLAELDCFDRILVTAAAPHIPGAVRRQLADPGRLVIPVGRSRTHQALTIGELHHGEWTETTDFSCVFVPLVGEDAW